MKPTVLRSSEFFGQVDMGICKYNASDHYAVLGLPVTADAAMIRKRYLTIAKSLHPDVYGRKTQDKEKATQIFAKIIGPAYNALVRERERVEYAALLKLIAKRLIKGNQKLQPDSEIARKLLYAPSFTNYQKYIKEVAAEQYQDLDRMTADVGILSELNLVFLAAKQGYNHFNDNEPEVSVSVPRDKVVDAVKTRKYSTPLGQFDAYTPNPSNTTHHNRSNHTPSSYSTSNSAKTNQSSQGSASAKSEGLVKQAETYISQKQWGLALKELRHALTIDRNSCRCYALLGLVYLHQKQAGMAKASFQQALKINPKEPIACKYMAKLMNKTAAQSENQPGAVKKKDGFFNWLGGQ
jgi:curved DNA-binding protein CbpA